MNGVDNSATWREHLIECGCGQNLIGNIQELLGQATLQTWHNLVEIQFLIVVDQRVAHIAQHTVAIEEVVQMQLEVLELYPHSHLGELDILQTVAQVAHAAHFHQRLGVV